MATTLLCKNCGSNNIILNGKCSNGQQKYHYKNCKSYRTFESDYYYSDERKEEILRAYKERSSLRGIRRIYGTSITTVVSYLNYLYFFSSFAPFL